MPSRPAPRAQARPSTSSRLASLFFAVGCLAVLGVTFSLGMAAGRRWPDGLPGLRGVRSAATAAPASAGSRGFDKDRAKPATDAPVLTFYRELTAPLPAASPPSVRTVAKSEAKPADASKPAARPPIVPPLAEAAPREKTAPAAASPAAEPRFTVQVGAFKARSQAEAVRTRLAEGGQDAYVSEGEAGGITQYRVRVGNFATREAAREAAVRLAAERQVGTYVTTR